jgi:teichuronic acid biosynthesis glycosyltransferase TuaC
MKVLFVSACGGDGLPKSIVYNQGISLEQQGFEIKYFCVKGSGIRRYIGAVPHLRKEIRDFSPDIVHAHYSFSGFLASLAGAKPLIVSLMGSDTNKSFIFRIITRFLIRFYWKGTIVKSVEMKKKLGIENVMVIPNGVDTRLFSIKEKTLSTEKTGFNTDMRIVLFPADTDRPEKNFQLAQKAVEMLNDKRLILIPLSGVPNKEMVWYYNAADLLLMTSFWEGSPNAVKEAMACGLPLVSTNVGDVKELTEGVENCYISSFDPEDISEKIRSALQSDGNTNGREKIFRMRLDSESVAKKIGDVYRIVIISQAGKRARI